MEAAHLYELIQNLKEVFDIVRLVDTDHMEICELNKDGSVSREKYHCYAVWEKHERCENCISAKSCAVNGRTEKFEFVKELITKYQIKPEYLELELTESAYVDDPDALKNMLKELQKFGFKILIDDFGSGEIGCEYAQGFLYSKPMPVTDYEILLNRIENKSEGLKREER